jgi:acid phosphatase type 7
VALKLKWFAPLTAVIAIACGGGSTPSAPSPIGGAPPPNDAPATLYAAGDIAMCDRPGAEQTARLLDTRPGTVLALGDLAYFNGTAQQFASCYGPTWGRHRSRTRPAPGNHDYETVGAGPYFDYFDEQAGPPGAGFYSFTAGGWHVISLNSNISMAPGSAQYVWLQLELNRPSRCTLAYWHHPLFSSGINGNNEIARPIWDLLYNAGAEVVLAGHDHVYERYLPQNPDGQLDRTRGIRQFIVGTGGAFLTGFATRRANSAVTHVGHGVLKLVLSPDRYEWEFVPVEGTPFSDAGFEVCH